MAAIRSGRGLGIWIIAASALLAMGPALADDTGSSTLGDGPQRRPTSLWSRVATTELATMRGGFDSPGGLSIVFSVERSVGLNGSPALIDFNGPISGNWGMSTNWIAVQNQINGQRIQISTLINATVSELGLLRSLSLQAALQAAVIGSVRH